MPSGGKRPGAGRKAGMPNKITAEREAKIAASGLTPLDYMLGILRDEKKTDEDHKWAAEKAAPFCHPKLANIDFKGEITQKTHEQALAELDGDDEE